LPDQITSATHLAWRSPDGRSGVWTNGDTDKTPGPHAEPFVASTGRWRRRGAAWRRSADQNHSLGEALAADGLDKVLADSRGVFAFVSAEPSGTAFAAADELGFCPLYHHSSPTFSVIGSRAGLVAQARQAMDGTAPGCDSTGVAWLALATSRFDDSTGYDGVDLLGQGRTLMVDANGVLHTNQPREPAWSASDTGTDPSEASDVVLAEMVESLTAAVDMAGTEPLVVDLTGGRDSRCLLAAILLAGLSHRCTFQTFGPRHIADVLIAESIAERFGLEHHRRLANRGQRRSPYESIHRTAQLSEAMSSGLRALPHPTGEHHLSVSGVFDGLRPHRPSPAHPIPLPKARHRLAHRMIGGKLGLIDPELVDTLRTTALQSAFDDPSVADLDPRLILDTAWLRFGLRQHVGSTQPWMSAHRILPTYSPLTLRSSFAIGVEARHSQLLTESIVAKVSNLGEIPYADETDRLGEVRRTRDSTSGSDAPRSGRAVRESRTQHGPGQQQPTAVSATVAQTYRSARVPDRAQALEQIGVEAPESAWAHLDRGAYFQAAADLATLDNLGRREVYGVATMLSWATSFSSHD